LVFHLVDYMMKIKLIKDLPINPIHGCVAGKEFDAEYQYDGFVRGRPVEFMSNGVLCVAFSNEYKVIQSPT